LHVRTLEPPNAICARPLFPVNARNMARNAGPALTAQPSDLGLQLGDAIVALLQRGGDFAGLERIADGSF
jgi:hypothetical protein